VRLLPLCAVLISLPVVCPPDAGWAQKTGLTREMHPWGRFDKGAWRSFQVVTESFDERGAVANTSVTETRTTLEDMAADGVTLRVEAVVQVAGKERDAEPQLIKQGFHGELANGNLTVRDLGTAELTIDGRRIPCKVEQLETTGPHSKTTTKVYYSSSLVPYVLKREGVTTDLDGAELSRSTHNVLSLDRPCEILRRRKRASHLETVLTHPKGSIVTRAFTSADVPGGVICHTSEERDANGRLVRRSTLRLVAYGTDSDEQYSVELKRLPRRALKGHRLSPGRD
jgi:hypothetical protein